MAFKMKGPSLYPKMNTATRLSQKLNVDHSASTSTSEGRAKSSAFQMKDGKTKEELIKEGFTPADADKMMKDGATTGKPKAKAKDKPMDPRNIDHSKIVPHSGGFTQKELDKMTEAQKESAIDGYVAKKPKTKLPKKAKKSTVAVDGQLNDAQVEYENDKKMIAKAKKNKKK